MHHLKPAVPSHQVVEHPRLGHRVEAIRALLEAAKSEEVRKAEWQEGAVPLPDKREEKHKAAEQDVSTLVGVAQSDS